MTLREVLSKIPLEHKIRIRTEKGSNFIFIGMAGQVNFERLNNQTKCRSSVGIMLAVFNYDPKHVKGFDRTVEAFKAWRPVEDREVIETYPGQLEANSTVIVITGGEGWLHYNPLLPPLKEISEQGAELLATKIYEGLCTELVHAYETGYTDLITRCEDEIRLNRYGILEQPEGIIRACRIKAGKE